MIIIFEILPVAHREFYVIISTKHNNFVKFEDCAVTVLLSISNDTDILRKSNDIFGFIYKKECKYSSTVAYDLKQ